MPESRQACRTHSSTSGSALMRAQKRRASDRSLIAVLKQPSREGAMSGKAKALAALALLAVAFAAAAAEHAGVVKIVKGAVTIERQASREAVAPGALVNA